MVMSYIRANPSTAQTNTSLVASISGTIIVVKEIYISSDTEMVVTLLNADAHTVLHRIYVGARGGLVLPHQFFSAQGEGLDYTTSASGNVYLAVVYERRGKG